MAYVIPSSMVKGNIDEGVNTRILRSSKHRTKVKASCHIARYRVVFIKYCVFFQEYLKVCHLSLANTRLLLVVQNIASQ